MVWKVSLPQQDIVLPRSTIPLDRQHHMTVCRVRSLVAVASNTAQPSVFVWDVAEKQLLHEITIPSFRHGIAQVQFIGNTVMLAILSADGHLVFVDAVESRYVCRMPTPHKVKSYKFTGAYRIVAIYEHFHRWSNDFGSVDGVAVRTFTLVPATDRHAKGKRKQRWTISTI